MGEDNASMLSSVRLMRLQISTYEAHVPYEDCPRLVSRLSPTTYTACFDGRRARLAAQEEASSLSSDLTVRDSPFSSVGDGELSGLHSTANVLPS
jgi:hypothetical protein